MIGTLRWNIMFGAVGFVLTCLVSLGNNVLSTTLVRSLLCGLVMFLIGFVFRWIMGSLIGLKELDEKNVLPDDHEDSHKGGSFDMTTPDDQDTMQQLIKQGGEASDAESFTPLKPPKLASTQNIDPEELVKALRHMSED
jgi:hypothetical protein